MRKNRDNQNGRCEKKKKHSGNLTGKGIVVGTSGARAVNET